MCGDDKKCLTVFVFIDLVLAILIAIANISIFSLILVGISAAEDDPKYDRDSVFALKIISWFYIVATILVTILEIWLFRMIRSGMKKSDATKCRTWWIFRIVLVIIVAISVIFDFASARGTIGRAIAFLLTLIYHGYELFIGKRFIDAIGANGPINA